MYYPILKKWPAQDITIEAGLGVRFSALFGLFSTIPRY